MDLKCSSRFFMTYTLTRNLYNSYGIFGTLTNGDLTFATLEHAYVQPDGSFLPKVAAGTYNCIPHAPNRLPYETYEITNVPDFMGESVTNILCHIGNYNADSEGCVLIGMSAAPTMIMQSGIAFRQFMGSLDGLTSFTLNIN